MKRERKQMKTIGELNLGFSDAQNYTQRANKVLFNNIFVKNKFLDKLLYPSTYFLIGEKGTGKTAYSVFLSNNNYKENKTIVSFISATDYEKFYSLKKGKKLELTDYVGIWKVIILLILSKSIAEGDIVNSLFNKNSINKLMKAIDEYYMNAFSPEIVTALKITDSTELAAKLVCKYSEVSGKDGTIYEFTETRFQMNLYYIEKKFTDAIQKLKLNKDINLFIDGIDIRPSSIPYNDYIECIRGLADACWSLNTELFQNVKDSRGHLKVVLLLRPDIFGTLNLQNATNKLRDNSVFLDWRTTYTEYKNSKLYQVSRRLLEYEQQCDADIWDLYLPWKLQSTSPKREYDTAFMEFLKISLSRPRDILVILQIIKEQMLDQGLENDEIFSESVYKSNQFQNAYSEYFMSSLKDQLAFYYSVDDFNYFSKFFDYFEFSDFNFEEYEEKYEKFVDYISKNAKNTPQFMDDPKSFLQLLYDCNIITAIENKEDDNNPYFHFSYREKSISNIQPKVPIDENTTYRFHYGLYKKARFGRF